MHSLESTSTGQQMVRHVDAQLEFRLKVQNLIGLNIDPIGGTASNFRIFSKASDVDIGKGMNDTLKLPLTEATLDLAALQVSLVKLNF